MTPLDTIRYLKSVQILDEKSIESIVLKHGKPYTPPAVARPENMKKGKSGYCYMNSYGIALLMGWTYVEGFAIGMEDFRLPFQHAWVVDDKGAVIETTWETPGFEYYGIPLELPFIHRVICETKVYGVLDRRSETFRKRFYADLT